MQTSTPVIEFTSRRLCNCGSSDGLAVYTDGHILFRMSHMDSSDGSTTKQQTNTTNYVGSAVRLNKRNISEKTCEKFKIYREGETLRFFYHNSDATDRRKDSV